MPKGFEDYFSELQVNMVGVCLEYVNHKANDIYIYCSYESSVYVFNVFFKIKNNVYRKHQLNNISNEFDTSIAKQEALLDVGIKNLEELHNKCKEFNRDMPTEMKLHYNVQSNKLNGRYRYDLVYSNDELLHPNDIFNEWFEEVKKEIEK